MKRCPECERTGVEYDAYNGVEKCLWRDCLWVNRENINLDKKRYKENCTKFKEAIKTKKRIEF